MRSIRRVLTAMISVLAVAATGTLAAMPSAAAKTGPLSAQSVWVGDGSQSHRTVLNSGNTATYHMDVYNTTGAAMLVDIEFEVFSADWASDYSYYYTAYNIKMAPGLSRFYSPSAIPVNAYTGDYIARISIWPANSANPSNDGDWGEAYFHVFSLSVSPVNDAIQALQDGFLCVGQVASLARVFLGEGGILLERVTRGAEAIGFFEDTETGNVYTAAVKLIPGVSCVLTLPKLGALFSVYDMVKI